MKISSTSIKKPHALFKYVHNKYARFQNDPLKIVREVDYRILPARDLDLEVSEGGGVSTV